MDMPSIIQEFGPMLNMETVSFEVRFRGERDTLPLPELQDCDYVPACALMVRRSLGRVDKLHLHATAAIFPPVCVSEDLT